MKDQIVATYVVEVSIGVPKYEDVNNVRKALNQAYGFVDGNCNYIEDGEIIPKPEAVDNIELEQAHINLCRSNNVLVEVSIRKDGTKSFRFI